MSYETTEYVARDEDGNVASRVNVYEVTEDRDGEKVQTTAGDVPIHTGDILVQSPNPNFWDVFSADAFAKLGYENPENTAPDTTATTPNDSTPVENVPTDDTGTPVVDPAPGE